MPQCYDPNCRHCNPKPEPKPEPVDTRTGVEKDRDTALEAIARLSDEEDLIYASDLGIRNVLTSLGAIIEAAKNAREKIAAEYPWIET